MNASIFIPAGVFVVLILTCLFVPIRLQLILNHLQRSVAISWFMVTMDGNLRLKAWELRFLNQAIVRKRMKKKDEVEEKRKRKAKPKKKKSRFNLKFWWEEKELLLQVVRVVLNFLWDILKGIRWNRLSMDVNLATPDPALTGILYGQLCAVKYSAEYFFPNARITVQPDFVNQSPKGSAESTFSIRPLNLIAPISKMFFALPKIQIFKTFILKKRR